MSRRKERTKLSVAFGHAARSLREKAGYTQEEFANDAGIDRAYYGLTERGGHTPTITTVWKIAEALGKRPRDVIAAVERELATSPKDTESSSSIGSKTKTSSHLDKDGHHLQKADLHHRGGTGRLRARQGERSHIGDAREAPRRHPRLKAMSGAHWIPPTRSVLVQNKRG